MADRYDLGQAQGELFQEGIKKGAKKVKEAVVNPLVKGVKNYGRTAKATIEGIKEKGFMGELADETQNFLFGDNEGTGRLKTGMNGEMSEEEKQKHAEVAAKRAEGQKEDVNALKTETESLEKEQSEGTKEKADEHIQQMEELLGKYINSMDSSKIYNEAPKTIRMAWKSGKFGDIIAPEYREKYGNYDDFRKAYRDELKKPRDKRDEEVINDFMANREKTKEARDTRNWYTLQAIGAGMRNIGSALKGGRDFEKTAWDKVQGARMADAQERYKQLLDTKANEVVEEAKNKGLMDRENERALRNLYQDKRLQPILNKLDTDSQIQLIDLMQQKSDAINFNTFINALAIKLMEDPKGAVSSVFSGAKNLVDLAK
jgi:hypothetical protein